MPNVQIDATKLEYVERGEGEPVVLVHGSLGDLRSWTLQMDAFAENHRVISYSRRYHHPNRCRGDETVYSADLHADDLAAFMTVLGIESAHIAGSSYGAYTALFLALRHRQRVRTLVLSEPPILPLLENHPEGAALREDFLAKVWGSAGEFLRQQKMQDGVRTFVDGLFGAGAFEQLPGEVESLMMDNACEFKAETSSPAFWTPLSHEDARRVATPTLLLAGENSLRMFQLVVDELARCLPNNEYVRVEESSHDLPGERPEAYNEIVLSFLAKHLESGGTTPQR